MLHYLNNRWVKKNELKISAFDLGLTRGLAVFEFLRTYNKKPFFLDEHLNRFFNSLKTVQIKPVKTKKQIKQIINEGIEKNNFLQLNIKIIQTAGESDDGLLPKGKGNLIIIFTPLKPYPKKYYQKGVNLITYNYHRSFPSVKTTDYLVGVLALKKARKKGAFEVLYSDGEKIYEGVTSNFFAVFKNALITPKEGILFGVTRNIVIKLAKDLNIKVIERDVFLNEIKNFDEAFITATNKEIMPVVGINGFKIGRGKVGKITKLLIDSWQKLIKNY